jgi:circadian clock protein KaiC
VLKSRGTAHSNQVREFVLTDGGIDLVDVYVGPEGVLAGSARLAQQARGRDAAARQDEELTRRVRDLRCSIAEREAQLVALQLQLEAERAEMKRVELRGARQVVDIDDDRLAMASTRWADAGTRDGGRV